MTARLDGRFIVAPDVQSRRFHDELVVLDLARGEYFALDEVGAKVWEALAKGLTLSDVAEGLAATYGIDRPRVEADVRALAAELLAQKLILHATEELPPEGAPAPESDRNRRA